MMILRKFCHLWTPFDWYFVQLFVDTVIDSSTKKQKKKNEGGGTKNVENLKTSKSYPFPKTKYIKLEDRFQ
jgi:hypothetical protein